MCYLREHLQTSSSHLTITKRENLNLYKNILKALSFGDFNRSSKLLENQVRAFLYLNKSESHLKGGIVLEGEIIDIAELSEKYWPEGEWKYYVTLKIIYIPKSVLSTTDTTRWKIIGLDKLKEIGVKILPGIQKIDNELGGRIEKLLGEIDAN